MMFTGIVTDLGRLAAVKPGRNLKRLRIECGYPAKSIALGASIMVNGICLTVVARGAKGKGAKDKGSWFEAEAGAETLKLTTAGRWQAGARLNLERSLKVGDELGGHIVSGHVDGLARIVARKDMSGMAGFRLRAPKALARFIAAKGSVTLNGVSLTVNEVKGSEFSVFLIPHTLQVTNWSFARKGDDVNLEVDMLARYAARLASKA
jgi:riboflavin synthase